MLARSTSGAWQTRGLNTEASDADQRRRIRTLSAGTFYCDIMPAGVCASHQAKLYTSRTRRMCCHPSEYADAEHENIARSRITGRFTIAASEALEVRHPLRHDRRRRTG